MTLPDHRLRFPGPRINFTDEVGGTGQDHDNWPAPNIQCRFDYLRMYLIALLSNQSSYEEPDEYREGTLWFDLNTLTIKIYNGVEWVELADAISLGTGTLQSWYDSIAPRLAGATTNVSFSGTCGTNNSTIVPIPASLQSFVDMTSARPLVYKNGLLLDPRSTPLQTTAAIVLRNGLTLDNGDTFSVVILNIVNSAFHIPDVVI